ncbi:MAG: alanine--tRNA ligase-related protein [Patescibacteria group bacterium]
MATKLLYIEDFDIVSCEAKVLGVSKTEDERTDIILDQTCFYPRGGGQDWDTGSISSDNGNFSVEEVRLDHEGVVHHIGSFGDGEFGIGEPANCEVDIKTRETNTRLHSAGHLLDMAVQELASDWIPGRGAHYPHMSFVEYEVPSGTETDEALKERLQQKVSELTQSDYQNKLLFMSKDEMAKYCRHVPDNLPSNKPLRIVLYADDFGIPCGGTHVKSTQEVGQINITKVKIKKGLAKVSYAVAGIN